MVSGKLGPWLRIDAGQQLWMTSKIESRTECLMVEHVGIRSISVVFPQGTLLL